MNPHVELKVPSAYELANLNVCRVAELRQALLAAVKPADMTAIAQKLIEMAREGSFQAAKLLLAYTLGRPKHEPAELSAEIPPAAPPASSLADTLASLPPLGALPPSANGILDGLREHRLVTPPAPPCHGSQRKK